MVIDFIEQKLSCYRMQSHILKVKEIEVWVPQKKVTVLNLEEVANCCLISAPVLVIKNFCLTRCGIP